MTWPTCRSITSADDFKPGDASDVRAAYKPGKMKQAVTRPE